MREDQDLGEYNPIPATVLTPWKKNSAIDFMWAKSEDLVVLHKLQKNPFGYKSEI